MVETRSVREIDRLNDRAAILSMIAGVVHGVATLQHIDEWWGYGIFFIVAAVAQLLYGVLLLTRLWQYDDTGALGSRDTRDARTVYLVGAIGNILIVVLFLITRTIGIPLVGPLAGTVEPFTLLGTLAQLIELVLIFHLIALARRSGAYLSSTGS